MKKTYLQPAMLAVTLQHSQILASSGITDVDGNGFDLGGGGDDYEDPIRVKSYELGNDEW